MKIWVLAVALCVGCCFAKSSFFSGEKEAFYASSKHIVEPVFVERTGSCPQDCQHHGTCNNGVCHCNSGWDGADCSIEVNTLSPNSPLSDQRVAARNFHYYSINVPSLRSLAFEVNATDSSSDCDLFVKYQSLPSLHDYDQRDISVGQNSRIDVRIKGAGKYYLGVFGFTECNYKVAALVSNDCPNSCSGHGSCHNGGGNAECRCDTGWGGPDCNTQVENMSPYREYTGRADSGAWTVYLYDMPSNYDALQITVNQTSSSGDSDLYVKHGSVPTLMDFDYRENGVTKNYALKIDGPPSGKLYVGVYAFSAVSWKIKAEPYQDCNNDCSGSSHGHCSASGCTCRSGYEGSYCETKREALKDNEVVTGFVADSAWNYYNYQADSDDALVLTVVQTTVHGHENPDCDVYVRNGHKPTADDYDYRDLGFQDEIQIYIDEGAPDADWHIGVFGFQPCDYRLNVTVASECVAGCRKHGTCLADHTCACNYGWAGEACDHSILTIQSDDTVSGTVGPNDWAYYVLPNVATSYISIHMEETDTTGFVWLYVEDGKFPTRLSHQYESNTDSQHHVIEIETGVEKGQKKDYYIGVYGSPFLEENEQAPFKLEAWVPPFKK